MTKCLKGSLIWLAALAILATGFVAKGTAQARNKPRLILQITVDQLRGDLLARAILAYVETAREPSDTGEETGIGADDVIFDNESGGGTETTITGGDQMKMETAEQWMRTVDTRTADFLRIRFALEAARARP